MRLSGVHFQHTQGIAEINCSTFVLRESEAVEGSNGLADEHRSTFGVERTISGERSITPEIQPQGIADRAPPTAVSLKNSRK